MASTFLSCLLFSVALLHTGKAYPGSRGNQTENVGEPNENDIHFWMYSKWNGVDNPVEFSPNYLSLIAAGWNPLHQTKILIHGYSSEGKGFARRYAEAYFQVGDFNVITVDWEKLAMWYDYFGAAIRTRFVGEHLAEVVKLLHSSGGNVHIIGHSLGSHVAGFAGKKVMDLGSHRVSRITGLDPAEPGFDLAGPNNRLDIEDADLVDVFHTNSGFLWEGCLSIPKSLGHVDFYPAEGKHQPGCVDICVAGICTEENINDLIKGGCSHDRANQYYVESILAVDSGRPFVAWRCDSWQMFIDGECCQSKTVVMGHQFPSEFESGKYMLMVGEEAPYSMGENGQFC